MQLQEVQSVHINRTHRCEECHVSNLSLSHHRIVVHAADQHPHAAVTFTKRRDCIIQVAGQPRQSSLDEQPYKTSVMLTATIRGKMTSPRRGLAAPYFTAMAWFLPRGHLGLPMPQTRAS